MRLIKKTRTVMVITAIIGMLMPTGLLSADELPRPESDATTAQNATAPQAIDVALGKNDVLTGNLVDAAGNPTADVNVFLFKEGRVVAAGQSNKKGEFAIAKLSGGVYQIAAGDRAVDVRCWTANTAPPTAVASTLIQVNDVQRGQIHPGTCLTANPWVAGGVIAAAILVPVAIKNIRDNRDEVDPVADNGDDGEDDGDADGDGAGGDGVDAGDGDAAS